MPSYRKTIRVPDELMTDIKAIAEELHQSENQVIETSLKFYRDYHYMQNKACFINEQILGIIQASYKMAENTINNKASKVISELAIQAAITNLILSDSLNVPAKSLYKYRLQALDFLRENNRVLRMDELIHE